MYRLSTKLLTTKLGGVLANRTMLSVVIAASLIVGALAVQIASMYSELASKERTIEQYLAAIDIQRRDVEAKTAQLNELNIEIAAKSQEVDNLGAELSAEQAEVAELQVQAQRLQGDIALLQSKIQSDEQYVASLLDQLELTQESAKRVRISHYSLAVLNSERGIVFPIEVEVINSGVGAISVDVSNAQYEDSFQSAVRTAAAVASEYTGEPISDKDIIVRILGNELDGEFTTIDGNSAGALITGMLIAGLTDKEVNEKVLVTGAINPNGTVGRVGSISEKTEAAQDFGATILLVPESQEFQASGIVVVGVSDVDDIVRYLVK